MNRAEHLLTILQEECAEIIQQVSKIKRFGIDNYQPVSGKTNRELLDNELHDFIGVLKMLNDEKIIEFLVDSTKADAKIEKVKRYLLISEEEGTLC